MRECPGEYGVEVGREGLKERGYRVAFLDLELAIEDVIHQEFHDPVLLADGLEVAGPPVQDEKGPDELLVREGELLVPDEGLERVAQVILERPVYVH